MLIVQEIVKNSAMYWNERFDLDDLCVQFPLDTLSRNNVKNDILLLFKKYLSNSERPDDIFNRLQLSQGTKISIQVQ